MRNQTRTAARPGFAAIADANVSFDAKTVLFAGKKAVGDPWQIWELTLADRAVRQVINRRCRCGAPLLSARPDGWSIARPDSSQGISKLQRCGPRRQATSCRSPTCRPTRFPTDVLADGRILFESGFPLGTGATPELFLVYSDGSGVESYRCDHGARRAGVASTGLRRRGLHPRSDTGALHLAARARGARRGAPRGDYAGAIAETLSGEWLLSARTAHGDALCAQDVEA